MSREENTSRFAFLSFEKSFPSTLLKLASPFQHLSSSGVVVIAWTNMSSNLGIPIRLIHESLGHVITVETKGGFTYRGQLYDGE
jgi:hypothetical protein